jgi:hypothetical protein
MTIITKSRIRVKPYIWGITKQEPPNLKIGLSMESVGTKTTELASLVYTLVKFELIRRNAYDRWQLYLNQVGLRLRDLTAYLNVLYDDENLINSLKAYYYKTKNEDYDKVELLREGNQLKEQLMEKVDQMRILSDFQVQSIRTTEQLQYE